jgi:transposase
MAKTGKTHQTSQGLSLIHDRAAGIDIGSTFHVVAIPPELDAEPVRTFGTFTQELHRLAEWLVRHGITTVAMESTGVYWVAVFEILEDHGIDAQLVNAREAKAVPGRKTDVNDAQWLQKLHACGLLRASFRPGRHIAALRTYLRQRERLLDYAAAHIQHMQKALVYMNLQLHQVVTDITGATGMKILRAIIAGERDAEVLAALRDVRCKASVETIREALSGHYQPEHLFSLTQAVALYDFYQQQVAACDVEIERTLVQLRATVSAPEAPLPKARHRTRQPNALAFNVRQALYDLLGIDLTQIHGCGPYLSLKLISECGTDLSRWPSAKHFTSWLGLSPGCKISGGKVLSSHSRKNANRLSVQLRLSATTIGRTNTALGAFYRRLGVRIGKAKAVTATARKLAVLLYNALRFGLHYRDPGADYYEQRYQDRMLKNLRRRAAELGYELTETVPVAGVS